MKVKKLLPLCLLGIMGLAACGGNAATDSSSAPAPEHFNITGDKKVTVWATAAEELVIKRVVTKYNDAQPDATTRFGITYAPVKEGDMQTEVGKDPAADSAPALFLSADDHVYPLSKDQVILEITGKVKEDIIANTTPATVTASSRGEKLYGFPVTSDNGYFLWYNKTMLTEAQIGSLEEILSYCKTNKKKFLMPVDNGWYTNSFFMSEQVCGVDSMKFKEDPNGKVIYDTTWDNAKGVAAAEYLTPLLSGYAKSNTLVGGENKDILAGFKDGTMAAAVSGTWMETDLIKAIGAENLGAVKLPTFKMGDERAQMGSFAGSKVYCVNKFKSAEEQANAVALGKLLTTKESQLLRFDVRKTIPCNTAALADKAYTEHVSLGSKGLSAQAPFSCAQAANVEGRYWNSIPAIGASFLSGDLGEYANWTEYLHAVCEGLRTPALS